MTRKTIDNGKTIILTMNKTITRKQYCNYDNDNVTTYQKN